MQSRSNQMILATGNTYKLLQRGKENILSVDLLLYSVYCIVIREKKDFVKTFNIFYSPTKKGRYRAVFRFRILYTARSTGCLEPGDKTLHTCIDKLSTFSSRLSPLVDCGRREWWCATVWQWRPPAWPTSAGTPWRPATMTLSTTSRSRPTTSRALLSSPRFTVSTSPPALGRRRTR